MMNIKEIYEKQKNFQDYLDNHRNLVAKYARKFCKHGKISKELCNRIENEHDLSKLQEPEYTAYCNRKWIEKTTGKDLYHDMDDNIKNAIVHHVKTNRHHPEFWSDDYRGFATTDPCHVKNMPEDAVIEMVCDWSAMGEKYHNTARNWYEKTKDTRWIYDKATTQKIEKWLKIMDSL